MDYYLYNRTINLHKYLKENYGAEALHHLQQWERNILKDIDYRNHRIFTLRCISHRLTPVSVKLQSANSKIIPGARKIIQKAERQLLQDRVRCINTTIEQSARGIDNYKTRLASLVTIMDMGKCSRILDKVRGDRYNRVKARQVRK